MKRTTYLASTVMGIVIFLIAISALKFTNLESNTNLTAILRPSVFSDIANEENNKIIFPHGTAYLGSSETTENFLGIIFRDSEQVIKRLPEVEQASLQIYSDSSQWIGISTEIYVGLEKDIATFSESIKPSSLTSTTDKVIYVNNDNWDVPGYYSIDITGPVREFIGKNYPTDKIIVVVKNTNQTQWGRKFFSADFTNNNTIPKLVINYK